MEAVRFTVRTSNSTVGAVCGDGWTGANPWRALASPFPVLLVLVQLVLLGVGVGVGAARLPSVVHHGGLQGLPGQGWTRLAPGPSVENDNPLPSNPSQGPGHGQGQGQSNARRCAALSSRVLRQVLGPAFNPAYMAFSLEEPSLRGNGGGFGSLGPFQSDHEARDTRGTDGGDSLGFQSPGLFSVDEDFRMVLSDEPAWQARYDFAMPTVLLDSSAGGHNYRTSTGRREKQLDLEEADEDDASLPSRSGRGGRGVWGSKDMQWHCESPLRWVDLGINYFPRYLRSADCGHHTCTGPGFECRPRSFTVKVLRRREGVCAQGPQGDDGPLEESTVGLPGELRDLWVWELRAVNFCCVCSLRV